jgi:hypothetical protein
MRPPVAVALSTTTTELDHDVGRIKLRHIAPDNRCTAEPTSTRWLSSTVKWSSKSRASSHAKTIVRTFTFEQLAWSLQGKACLS